VGRFEDRQSHADTLSSTAFQTHAVERRVQQALQQYGTDNWSYVCELKLTKSVLKREDCIDSIALGAQALASAYPVEGGVDL